METDNLNIFQPIWYDGSNFEFVDNPINHNSNAKLILFDATVKRSQYARHYISNNGQDTLRDHKH